MDSAFDCLAARARIDIWDHRSRRRATLRLGKSNDKVLLHGSRQPISPSTQAIVPPERASDRWTHQGQYNPETLSQLRTPASFFLIPIRSNCLLPFLSRRDQSYLIGALTLSSDSKSFCIGAGISGILATINIP